MHRLINAYIYRESTVVIDKNTINGANEEDFRPVNLILSEHEIERFYEEIQNIREMEEREESA